MDAIKVKLIGLSRGGGGNLQPNKDATPTEQTQIVQPDPGYDGLRQVTVDPIPDEYADVSNVDAGAGDVRVGKVIVGSDGETITGTMPPQKPEEVGHATPTEQAQTVTPTAGSVFSAVEVGAIPSEYADVSSVDATAADVRTGKIIVDAQGDTVTGVMEPQKPEQVKSATPTTSPQSVTPDTGYALSRVDVGAVPSEYADVSDVTATAGTVLTGSDFVDASGALVHGTCDYDADTSDADATAGQIEAGATAYVGGTKITGTMPIRTTDVEIDSLSPVPIPAGSYDGTTLAHLTAAAAAEVDPAVIKKDAVILGQVGTYQGADTLGGLIDNTLESYSNDTSLSVPAWFRNKTSLTFCRFSVAVSVATDAFNGCVGLVEADFPLVETFGNRCFYGDSALESVNAPRLTSVGSTGSMQTFRNCSRLVYADFPMLTAIRSDMFYGCSALRRVDSSATILEGVNTFDSCTLMGTLILRGDAVCVLSDARALTRATPFKSGGTGGTIYIPESLYDHLGDGTAYDYKAATNWSVIDAYGTITWAKIEGSQYEVTP